MSILIGSDSSSQAVSRPTAEQVAERVATDVRTGAQSSLLKELNTVNKDGGNAAYFAAINHDLHTQDHLPGLTLTDTPGGSPRMSTENGPVRDGSQVSLTGTEHGKDVQASSSVNEYYSNGKETTLAGNAAIFTPSANADTGDQAKATGLSNGSSGSDNPGTAGGINPPKPAEPVPTPVVHGRFTSE